MVKQINVTVFLLSSWLAVLIIPPLIFKGCLQMRGMETRLRPFLQTFISAVSSCIDGRASKELALNMQLIRMRFKAKMHLSLPVNGHHSSSGNEGVCLSWRGFFLCPAFVLLLYSLRIPLSFSSKWLQEKEKPSAHFPTKKKWIQLFSKCMNVIIFFL